MNLHISLNDNEIFAHHEMKLHSPFKGGLRSYADLMVEVFFVENVIKSTF